MSCYAFSKYNFKGKHGVITGINVVVVERVLLEKHMVSCYNNETSDPTVPFVPWKAVNQKPLKHCYRKLSYDIGTISSSHEY